MKISRSLKFLLHFLLLVIFIIGCYLLELKRFKNLPEEQQRAELDSMIRERVWR
jgi:hypothetical protein